MSGIRIIKANMLRQGDILTWNSGFYDYIDKVTKNTDNKIVVNCNGEEKPMLFDNNYVVRIVRKTKYRGIK